MPPRSWAAISRRWVMSEHLPVGWSIKPLGDLAQVVSGGTPSRNVPFFWDDGTIPWVTPTDITATHGKYISESKDKITKLGLTSCSANLLPPGSILMTSRATLGEAKISVMPACTNQGFKSLVANKGISNEFLYYQIQRTKREYARYGSGSTFLEVGKKDTLAFPVLIPDEASQTKLAEVLSLIDIQIEATEALIAKQEQVRAGLMQDLFRRGVDKHGQLRRPHEQAPHLYHQTELGWLPKGWAVKSIQSMVRNIIDYRGVPPPKSDSGFPLITAKNVRFGYLDPEPREYIAEADFYKWMRRGVPLAGDVLFTTEAPLGNVAQIPAYKLALGQRTLTLQPDSRWVGQTYLKWALMSGQFQKRVMRLQSGSTATGIQSRTFRRIFLELPSTDEQGIIADRLQCAELLERANLDALNKLRLQKSGLMQGLLTGKVSIAPLLEGAAA